MMMSSGAISEMKGMLPAMKITEPYSPTARASASAKPVRIAGISDGSMTRNTVWRRLAPRVADGLLELAVELLEHRLHGAHHKGEADEDQRDDDAGRRIGDLDAERREQLPIQPFGA